ncbi:nucleoside monophosphate kinase [Nocardia sp. NPDC046763]|uniref:nucleoside monophosphate kinase n=1 Tax=Nocardia sp. NPDC046763 TaxID=3155256 RepID=UPI0033D71AC2
MRSVLLGPKGSGKGMRAWLLSAHLGLPHISTGELLREAVRVGIGPGREVKALVESLFRPSRPITGLVASS